MWENDNLSQKIGGFRWISGWLMLIDELNGMNHT